MRVGKKIVDNIYKNGLLGKEWGLRAEESRGVP